MASTTHRHPGLKVEVWRSSLELICLSKLCIDHTLILCFSYLVLHNGSLSLSVNHGSGSLFLKFGKKANVLDQRWHNLKIMSNGKVQPMDINVATGTTCFLIYIKTGRLSLVVQGTFISFVVMFFRLNLCVATLPLY